MSTATADPRATALADYRAKLLSHREAEAKLKESRSLF